MKYICTKRESGSGFTKHFTAIAGNNIKHDTPRADLYFLPKEKLKLNVLSIAKCISSDNRVSEHFVGIEQGLGCAKIEQCKD